MAMANERVTLLRYAKISGQTLRLKTMDFCVSIIWSAPAMKFCAAQRRATRLRCDKETAAFELIRVAFPCVTLAIAVD